MTTNLSFDQVKDMLDTADQKDRNIRIKYQIQSCVDFFGVAIQNDNGYLTKSVFHKPTAEPYILPYKLDHPHHVHRNISYAALLRAARICSSVHDFTIERIRIDISLLLNDYPPAFITKHVSRFFDQYNAQSVLKQLNEQDYSQLHHKLLHQPTRREKQLQAIPTDGVAQMLESLMRKKAWNPNILYAPYQFESGPRTAFGPIFRAWWEEYFRRQGSKVAHMKVKFSAKSNRTLEQCFVHKKPPKELLKKMDNTLATTTGR
ncbi:unnamed protein product [Didymodactylos carnosus]|uniref:Helix-turn-helix domain-containing protein n=1 Tax=Didymodactylos carnosus TaxID=1234261 RepID=A0A8S2F1E4_9BILA|nr:unnamed protein product [Didymodactylos carnosus]CAF4179215.1 unnamed protein product [Didymodactylos carnosus]CAF4474353.1 unnamed protein product [Didymodactylos carnosus]